MYGLYTRMVDRIVSWRGTEIDPKTYITELAPAAAEADAENGRQEWSVEEVGV